MRLTANQHNQQRRANQIERAEQAEQLGLPRGEQRDGAQQPVECESAQDRVLPRDRGLEGKDGDTIGEASQRRGG